MAYARLATGVQVVGVVAGYVYSFIKDAAAELRWVRCAADGSQFRSRDLFPAAAAAILRGDAAILDEGIHPADLPDIPEASVAYIDGYGNIKTTIPGTEAQAREGQTCRVRIGSVEHAVVVCSGSFAVEPGQIALAPESSGWPQPDGSQLRWVEILLRGGSASEAFGRPAIGSPIEILK